MPRVEVFDRAQVLEKVKHLFWDKGFHGTSMQDLVDVTGLNRSSIYNSFGSKKELYDLVLRDYQEESKAFLKSAIVDAEDPLQAIELIFKTLVRSIYNDVEGKGCFLMNCTTELSRSDNELKTFLVRGSEGMIELFEDIVKEGQILGVINNDETPKNYALYLYSSFQGIRITGVLITDKTRLDQIVKNIIQILT